MNTHARTRKSAHVKLLFLMFLIAAIGMTLGSVPAAAQVAPESFLATQFFAAIGDEATAYQLSADAVLHTPEGDFSGPAGLVQFGEDLGASFAHLAFTTESVAQAGDLTIVSFTLSGIHIGAFHGAVSDCASIAVPAVAVLRVTEQTVVYVSSAATPSEERADTPGLEQVSVVTEHWIGYDSAAIVRQIATFNTIDPALTRGCAEYFGLQPVPADEQDGQSVWPAPPEAPEGQPTTSPY